MNLVGSIDQGTTSTRFILFDLNDNFKVVSSHQIEFHSIVTQPGYCEHDPMVIIDTVRQCILYAMDNIGTGHKVASVGITNQRETTVAWDSETGLPLFNAIVWMDTRTKTIVDQLLVAEPQLDVKTRQTTGLPVSTYFSALKMKWLLDNVSKVKQASEKGRLRFGTIDTWIIWNMTKGKSFVTDVTNASRTLLMNLKTCEWDSDMLKIFGIKKEWLPEIKASSTDFGVISDGPLAQVSVNGVLGDQQSSLVGHQCFKSGQAKNTYGTGCFMLFNSGPEPVFSSSGMLTTVAYKLGPDRPSIYALEGSIATAGSAIVWLRDKLGLISSSKEIGELAAQVPNSSGVFFVPALSGLLAPYWDPDARGIITGLSNYTTKHHICRALLEALSFQTREIVESMQTDANVKLSVLKVDGGLTNSDVFVQIQSDVLGIEVSRPDNREMTALGAAFAAGIGIGILELNTDGHLRLGGKTIVTPSNTMRFDPVRRVSENEFQGWKEAVKKALSK